MGTKNPRVSTYLPKPLYRHLQAFRKERSCSESKAVILILAEYFGVELSPDDPNVESPSGVTPDRLASIEQRLSVLEQMLGSSPPIGELAEAIAPSDTGEEASDETLDGNVSAGGDSETEEVTGVTYSRHFLRTRWGVGPKTIDRYKYDSSFTEWSRSKDPDGIGWFYLQDMDRYAPETDLPVEEEEGDRVQQLSLV